MRVGTDIGGTFTDLVAVGRDGELRTSKVPSVPEDQSQGFQAAIRDAVERPAGITDVAHGSTVGVNALLERKTPKIAVLCTEGHRDVLEVRRAWREHLFGNWWSRPVSLVERSLRFEIPERIDAGGVPIRDLDESAVRSVLTHLREAGIPAASVAFINSHVNSAHEQRVVEIGASEFPELQLVASSDLLPEIGEYERTSTSTVAAMLKPVMDEYLSRLTMRLHEIGADEASVRIMRSSGALMTLDGARSNPVATLTSGPAGGVRACLELGRAMGEGNLLTLDMGGTSTEVAVIDDFTALETMERDLEWNIPIRAAMLDIQSIGAGGGSIAFMDAGGVLQVGPESAGATPGPACYGRGGERPTVTDAALALGWIAPEAFLGGGMVLDVTAAERAIGPLAEALSLEIVPAAAAIMQITLAQMALLVREASVNRGYDPRQFTLIPFGGAGPLVAGAVARELSVPRVCVPRHASVFSALGGLMGDIAYDYGRSCTMSLDEADHGKLDGLCDELRADASSRLARDQLAVGVTLEFSLDLHYVGSSHSLRVGWDPSQAVDSSLKAAAATFTEKHLAMYAFARTDDAIELSAVRLRVTVAQDKPAIAIWEGGAEEPAPVGERQIFFAEVDKHLRTPIYDRDSLAAGSAVRGPSVIQEDDTATIIHPHQRVQVDPVGSLLIDTGVAS